MNFEFKSKYGDTGDDIEKFNKIRDIEIFDFNGNKYMLVVDHRNHRIQLIQIKDDDTFTYILSYNGPDDNTLVLPANLKYYKDGIFFLSEVKGSERVLTLQLSETDGKFIIKTLSVLEGSLGPGGMIFTELGETTFVIFPEYTNNCLQICKFQENSLIPIYRYYGSDNFLKSPIDLEILFNKYLLLVDCQNSRIVILTIDNPNLNPDIKYYGDFKNDFNFTYSAGAITVFENNNNNYIAIADSENDKVKIYHVIELDNDLKINLINTINTIKKDEKILFPTSLKYDNNYLYVSNFHHHGKTETYGFDYISKFLISITEMGESKNLIIKNGEIDNKIKDIISFSKEEEPNYSIVIGVWSDEAKETKDIILFDKEEDETYTLKDMMKILFLDNRQHLAKLVDSSKLKEYYEKLATSDKITKITNEVYKDKTIFTYKQDMQISMKGWTIGLLLARGLLYEKEKIIALPFPKFWNCGKALGGCSISCDVDRSNISIKYLNELMFTTNGKIGIGGKFLVEEKVDGSLGIIYYNKTLNEWDVITKGSFDSEQSKTAARWIKELDIKFPDKNATYLVEIIYPNQDQVVEYNENNLILLGGYNEYGFELKPYELNDIIRLNKKGDSKLCSLFIENQKNIEDLGQKILDLHNNVKKYCKNFDKDTSVIFRRPIITNNLTIDFTELSKKIRSWSDDIEGVIVIWKYNNGTSYRMKVKSDNFCIKQQLLKNYTPEEAYDKFIKGGVEYDKWVSKSEEEYSHILLAWKDIMETELSNKIDLFINAIDILKKNSTLFNEEEKLLKNKEISEYLKGDESNDIDAFVKKNDNILFFIITHYNKTQNLDDIRKLLIEKFINRIVSIPKIFNNDNNQIIEKKIYEEGNQDGKNMELVDFLVDLYKYINDKTDKTDKILEKMSNYLEFHYQYNLKKLPLETVDNVYMIKYIEGSKIWNKWSIKARGTIVSVDDGNFLILKQLLDRGAELLMPNHINNEIKGTQDIETITNIGETPKFDKKFTEKQIETMEYVYNQKTKFKGVLSMKVDGSLSSVSVYKKGEIHYEKMIYYIDKLPDKTPYKYYKQMLKLTDEDSEYLVLLSSQATLFFSNGIDHFSWNICAIIIGFLNISENEIYKKISEGLKIDLKTVKITDEIKEKVLEYLIDEYWKKFSYVINTFIQNLKPFISFNENEGITLSFESVCANRKDIFGTIKYVLAMSYNTYMFRFLGININIGKTTGKYYPHCDENIQKLLISLKSKEDGDRYWKDPLFWNNDKMNGKSITDMLKSLDDVIHGELTILKFLEKYKPGNHRYQNVNTSDEMKAILNDPVDYEGFVLYRIIKEDGETYYQYNKVKHQYFYKLHKIKFDKIEEYSRNIPNIICKWYPNLQKAKLYYSSFDEIINNIIIDSITLLDNIGLNLNDEQPLNSIKEPNTYNIKNIQNYNKIPNIYGRIAYLEQNDFHNIINIPNQIHDKIMNIFIDNFNKYNMNITLTIPKKGLRDQGFQSIIYEYHNLYKNIIPFELIQDIDKDYIKKFNEGTLSEEIIQLLSKKTFMSILFKILSAISKYHEIKNLKNIDRNILINIINNNKIKKIFFNSTNVVSYYFDPLKINNLINDKKIRFMTFNMLSSRMYKNEWSNYYGGEPIHNDIQKDKRRENIINYINIIKPDILFIQESDYDFPKKEININTDYKLELISKSYKKKYEVDKWISLGEDENKIDYINTYINPSKFIIEEDDKKYSKSGSLGEIIKQIKADGSAYTINVIKDITQEKKILIINLHIRVKDWNTKNYSIAESAKHLIETIQKYELNKSSGINSIIIAGDLNGSQYQFVRNIDFDDSQNYSQIYNNIIPPENKVYEEFGSRHWNTYKANLISGIGEVFYKVLNEIDIHFPSSIGYYKSKQLDHIFTNNINNYYHLDTSSAKPLILGNTPASKTASQAKNLENIDTILSDHLPKIVDLYYNDSDEIKFEKKIENTNVVDNIVSDKISTCIQSDNEDVKQMVVLLYVSTISKKFLNILETKLKESVEKDHKDKIYSFINMDNIVIPKNKKKKFDIDINFNFIKNKDINEELSKKKIIIILITELVEPSNFDKYENDKGKINFQFKQLTVQTKKKIIELYKKYNLYSLIIGHEMKYDLEMNYPFKNSYIENIILTELYNDMEYIKNEDLVNVKKNLFLNLKKTIRYRQDIIEKSKKEYNKFDKIIINVDNVDNVDNIDNIDNIKLLISKLFGREDHLNNLITSFMKEKNDYLKENQIEYITTFITSIIKKFKENTEDFKEKLKEINTIYESNINKIVENTIGEIYNKIQECSISLNSIENQITFINPSKKYPGTYMRVTKVGGRKLTKKINRKLTKKINRKLTKKKI